MNLTHVHLLTNHLPVFFTAAGSIVLLIGLFKLDQTTFLTAFVLFIIAAVGAFVAFYTGEPAAEAVEHIQGVSHDMIEEHEEMADKALISFILLGSFSILGWLLSAIRPEAARRIAIGLVFFSIISFAVAARTAYIGGKIRHTEIRGDADAAAENPNQEHNEELD